MSNRQKENSKRRLLQKIRKQRLKYITILPSLITLINGISGFAAIIFASKAGQSNQIGIDVYSESFPFFTAACYMIGLAMVADMLDGRVARMSHSTSSFGGQLDSLCDVISFGVAPAVLMLNFMSSQAGFTAALDVFVYRFLWLAGAIYLGCTAIRLARFNVENEEDEASHNNFSGLPTPAAAGVIASLIFLHQYLLPQAPNSPSWLGGILQNMIVIVVPFATLAAAVLMISRLRYPHLVNQYLRGKKPFAYLLWTVVLLILVIFIFEISAAIVFCGFAASGPVRWVYQKITMSKAAKPDNHAASDVI